MTIKFKDSFHEDTKDAFKIVGGYESTRFVRVFQEFHNSGMRDFLLTEKDIRQILEELEKVKRK